jgi:hypothetical protein
LVSYLAPLTFSGAMSGLRARLRMRKVYTGPSPGPRARSRLGLEVLSSPPAEIHPKGAAKRKPISVGEDQMVPKRARRASSHFRGGAATSKSVKRTSRKRLCILQLVP